jgi:RHS repeat-associated protein
LSARGYDANGNATNYGSYDYENRLAGGGGDAFSYGPDNLRTYKYESNGTEYVYFYDPFGHRMGAYETSNTTWVQYDVYCACGETTAVWFGGMTLAGTDRLGSAESGLGYYPYGEEYTPPSGDGDDFATYYHDADTGLDYARNRYYTSILGRFLSPDPSTAKAFADPGQWNKYVYVGNDPVNFYDPLGLQQLAPENNPFPGDYRSDGGGGGGACGILMNVPPDPESGSSGGVDCILNNPSGSSPAGGPTPI